MTEFLVIPGGHVSSLTHTFQENSSVIVESATFPPIVESDGWLSPFIIPTDIELVEDVSTITIPNILYRLYDESPSHYTWQKS